MECGGEASVWLQRNMAVKQVLGYSEHGSEASVWLQQNMAVKEVFGYSGTWW